jgi:hypothetical protein
MTAGAKVESFAVRQRRASRREEWTEQTKLAQLLPKYLNPKCTFWSHSPEPPCRQQQGPSHSMGDAPRYQYRCA